MLQLFIITSICILSYFFGCYSTARLLAKSFRHLNILKVGTGLADISNIYHNISKQLGFFAAILDITKIYIFLTLLKYLLLYTMFESASTVEILTFMFGFFMILGHCMPVTNSFKGGRGIFTYVGLMLVFIPYYMLAILGFALLIFIFFKQFRFIQYMIVLLPPIVSFFVADKQLVILMSITAVLMGILNFFVSKRYGEI